MHNILVIDDDAAVCDMLQLQLERAGYTVAVASDGLQGLEQYQQRKPTLIITDIIMPGKEGLETIMELRKLDPAMNIIAISAGSRLVPVELLHSATLLGAVRTFTKPVDIRELLAVVAELCD